MMVTETRYVSRIGRLAMETAVMIEEKAVSRVMSEKGGGEGSKHVDPCSMNTTGRLGDWATGHAASPRLIDKLTSP